MSAAIGIKYADPWTGARTVPYNGTDFPIIPRGYDSLPPPIMPYVRLPTKAAMPARDYVPDAHAKPIDFTTPNGAFSQEHLQQQAPVAAPQGLTAIVSRTFVSATVTNNFFFADAWEAAQPYRAVRKYI